MAKRAPSSFVREALKKLKDRLTCPVCRERFEQPRTLPCLHSFCLHCLQQLSLPVQGATHLIFCPSCRQSIPLPDKAPSNFPPAFHVNNLLDLHELLQKVSGSRRTNCGSCHKEQSISYCKQCALFLCQTCVDHHKGWGPFSHHELTGVEEVAASAVQLIPLKEPPIMNCHAHTKPLEIFCETCDQLICEYCTNKLHRDHDYDLVAEVFPKHKQRLERELQPVRQLLSTTDAALKVIKERAHQISGQGQEVEQQIHMTAGKAIKSLQESERQLREKVKTGVQQKLQGLFQQIETVETNLSQLKSCLEFVEEEMRVGSQQQVLTMEEFMVERMRTVSSQARSSELAPVEEANIKFTVNEEMLSQCSALVLEGNDDHVNNPEALKEQQWLMALENGNTELAEKVKRQRKRKKDVVVALEQAKHKKCQSPGDPPPSKLTRMMMRLWELTVEARDENGRLVSDIFMTLPTRKELPGYYRVIKKPIDLKKIKECIMKQKYSSLKDMEDDMSLLWSNARTFNGASYQIFLDSFELENRFWAALTELETVMHDNSDEEQTMEDEVCLSGTSNVFSTTQQRTSKGKSRHSCKSCPKKYRRVIVVSDDEDSTPVTTQDMEQLSLPGDSI